MKVKSWDVDTNFRSDRRRKVTYCITHCPVRFRVGYVRYRLLEKTPPMPVLRRIVRSLGGKDFRGVGELASHDECSPAKLGYSIICRTEVCPLENETLVARRLKDFSAFERAEKLWHVLHDEHLCA